MAVWRLATMTLDQHILTIKTNRATNLLLHEEERTKGPPQQHLLHTRNLQLVEVATRNSRCKIHRPCQTCYKSREDLQSTLQSLTTCKRKVPSSPPSKLQLLRNQERARKQSWIRRSISRLDLPGATWGQICRKSTTARRHSPGRRPSGVLKTWVLKCPFM